MRKYFNVEDSVCEVCCGTGHYSSLLSYQVSNVTGIDFADVLIEKARQRKSLANFIVGDAREMPFEDNQFDGVISFSALYYIKEINEAFREIHRIIKSNGVAIIELGNLYSINTLLTKGKEMQSYHISTREMSELIKSNNFGVLEHRRFQVIMSKYFQNDMYRLLSKKIRKKMIDEHISTALSPLAFRHLFVLRKWD